MLLHFFNCGMLRHFFVCLCCVCDFRSRSSKQNIQSNHARELGKNPKAATTTTANIKINHNNRRYTHNEQQRKREREGCYTIPNQGFTQPNSTGWSPCERSVLAFFSNHILYSVFFVAFSYVISIADDSVCASSGIREHNALSIFAFSSVGLLCIRFSFSSYFQASKSHQPWVSR